MLKKLIFLLPLLQVLTSDDTRDEEVKVNPNKLEYLSGGCCFVSLLSLPFHPLSSKRLPTTAHTLSDKIKATQNLNAYLVSASAYSQFTLAPHSLLWRVLQVTLQIHDLIKVKQNSKAAFDKV